MSEPRKKRGPVSYSTYQEAKDRIAELEAVAEAAVVVHEQGPLGNFSEWEVLGDALRASGYLNE